MANKEKYRTATGYLNKEWLVRELAERHDFYIKDVEVIMDGFGELLHELVAEDERFMWWPLFKMRIKEYPGYSGWNGINNVPIEISPSKRVVITALKSLNDMIGQSLDEYEDEGPDPT